MGVSSEQYIEMCDKMMAELNEEELGYIEMENAKNECTEDITVFIQSELITNQQNF